MAEARMTLRLDEELQLRLKSIAAQRGCSLNEVLNDAAQMYCDQGYMNDKEHLLSDAILAAIDAAVKTEIGRFEKRTVDRMAQLIGAMAIELFTIDRAVSDGLEITRAQANDYRAEAVEFLKDNRRIAKLLDMADE